MGLVGGGVTVGGSVSRAIVTGVALGSVFNAPSEVGERAVDESLNVGRHGPAD